MFDLIGVVSNLFCVELIATKEYKALLESEAFIYMILKWKVW